MGSAAAVGAPARQLRALRGLTAAAASMGVEPTNYRSSLTDSEALVEQLIMC